MTVLVAIQITDSALALRPRHHHLAASLAHQEGDEGQCSRTKYRLRSYSTGSLAAVWAVALSVRLPLLSTFSVRACISNSVYTGGGGGLFDTGGGPQVFFNLGGGPGFRVHQFGGARPRRRPQEANNSEPAAPQTFLGALSNLLPLLILFVLPLLSSIFSATTPTGPGIRLHSPDPPYTALRTTSRFNLDYYINPSDVSDFTPRKFTELDKRAESEWFGQLQYECQIEARARNRLVEEAQGWFFPDEDKMRRARTMEMRSCRKLDSLGVSRGY